MAWRDAQAHQAGRLFVLNYIGLRDQTARPRRLAFSEHLPTLTLARHHGSYSAFGNNVPKIKHLVHTSNLEVTSSNLFRSANDFNNLSHILPIPILEVRASIPRPSSILAASQCSFIPLLPLVKNKLS